MRPSIGRIVTFKGLTSNGTDEHPAIITRTWSDEDPACAPRGTVLVNLTVFPDMMAPQLIGSVYMFDTRSDAAAHSSAGGHQCFWPDRK